MDTTTFSRFSHLGDQGRDVDRPGDRILLPGIDHQLADDSGAGNRHHANSVQLFFGTGAAGELLDGQIGLRQHPAQQVVEVVSDAAGEPSDAFQFLPREILFLAALQIGDIGTVADITGEIAFRSEARSAAAKHPPVLAIRAP